MIYVIATGKNHSVREFIGLTAEMLGMDIEWQGSGLDEVGIDKNTGKTIIEIDEKYFRPTEVDELIGDPVKAKEKLDWTPKTSFEELVGIMVRAEFEELGIDASKYIK